MAHADQTFATKNFNVELYADGSGGWIEHKSPRVMRQAALIFKQAADGARTLVDCMGIDNIPSEVVDGLRKHGVSILEGLHTPRIEIKFAKA